ncbi:MAG TPA: ABC transporter ATP-binding protein [Dissulfurispiraceae bacterium]|nr:ABC transporter ATP-binding protein [Dissulfurispiraceae bacterium]
MSDKLLEVKDLSITFRSDGDAMQVVSDISFDIGKAEVFGLVGESGSGKSMTALSIMRILPGNAFAEGRIMFRNRNLLAISEEEIRGIRGKDISMIFQEPMTSLNPVLTVGFQVAEALLTHFDMSKSEAMNRSIELLRSVKIPAPELRIKDYPHQLSGGMRQRVMIAMAIACNPELLIADEPTTALDVTIQAQILDLVKRLRQDRKMAILLITHDLSIISEQAERVAVMYAGRIMELAGVEELFGNPLHPYTVGLLESLPDKKGIPLKPISGLVPSPELYPKGCKFSDRCTMTTNACVINEPKLLEVSSGHFVRCCA